MQGTHEPCWSAWLLLLFLMVLSAIGTLGELYEWLVPPRSATHAAGNGGEPTRVMLEHEAAAVLDGVECDRDPAVRDAVPAASEDQGAHLSELPALICVVVYLVGAGAAVMRPAHENVALNTAATFALVHAVAAGIRVRTSAHNEISTALAALVSIVWRASQGVLPKTSLSANSPEWDVVSWVIYFGVAFAYAAYQVRAAAREEHIYHVLARAVFTVTLFAISLAGIHVGHMHHSMLGFFCALGASGSDLESAVVRGVCLGVFAHGIAVYGI